ncbi:MAG: HEAT repeat domain-containing protein [Candidatus Thorarchaeota archaeon]
MIIEIILLVAFFVFFIIGFYIIYRQVALVKKGEFNIKDRFQCIFYGIIFGLSIMVVFAVAVIYTINTPGFWQTLPPEVNPLVLIIPFLICLSYIALYPLIDFLFIALSKESDEGLTPFHKFISEKIIQKSWNRLIKVLFALVLYFIIFVIPPIILTILGLPFIIIIITWMLVYPLMILTFYGSKGYIAGISNAYYHIPDIRRSIFLNFEDSKRGIKQFISEPIYYILFGLMLFVFVWAWISLIQTIVFFFTKTLAISTMSSVFVFVTLLFGILGYFTRFWGRKIKYRGIDIYFAAYLMASIGINVLVNFLIVNPLILEDTFNLWSLTVQMVNQNYIMLTWAAIIEEIVLIVFTSYFFLARGNEFIANLRYSKITESGQKFDPVPLFNLIKVKNPRLNEYAKETLIMMYERIPLKDDIDLNNWKFKYSLLDGICDYDESIKKISRKILIQLIKDEPDLILPWIIEALKSPNYDKSILVSKILEKVSLNFLETLPKNIILDLIEDTEWRLKLLGLKILSRLIEKDNDLISQIDVKKLINDPNPKIGIEILKITAKVSYELPIELIIDKIYHINHEFSAAALKNIKNTDLKQVNRKFISNIVHLINNPSSSVRESIFVVLAKIGKFKKYSIPLLPFLEGLVDSNKQTRKASVKALLKYFEEEPGLFNVDTIIHRVDPNDFEVLNTVVSFLGYLWNYDPEKILKSLLIFIKFENLELRENISEILVENYKNTPDLIVHNLIKIPDVSKFIKKGIISETFIKLGKKYPKKIIPTLMNYLNNVNEDIRLNAINSIDGLVEEFLDYIDIKQIMVLLNKDKNIQVKKVASILISKLAQKDSSILKSHISEFLNLLTEKELSLRIALSKSLLQIAKESPDIIPTREILDYLDDDDSFIREVFVKIMGYIGYKLPLSDIDILINKLLKDDEWIVREAAVTSLGKIANHFDNKEKIIEKLVSLFDDEQNWVRRSAMNILSTLKDVRAFDIPIETLKKNLESTDPKVREASAGLLPIYSNQIENIFEYIIKLLGDESKEVRNSAINNLVKIIQKIGIKRIISKLLQNLSDEGSLETQRSIALIFSRTVKYENEEIRKRVISLLKIRCEMSQDPIICEVFQQLKEI